MKKLATIILAILLIPSFVSAQNTSLWSIISNNLKPVVSSWGLQIPSLGSTGNPCVSVSTTGVFATTTCGGGSSGTSTPSIGSAGWVQFASSTSGYFDAVIGFIYNKASSALSINGTMSANIYVATSTTATSSLPNISASSTLITATNIGAIATTSKEVLILQNTTTATSGSSQNSPAIMWQGSGWKSNATAVAQITKFRAFVQSLTGATISTAIWKLQGSVNNTAWADLFSVDEKGQAVINTQSGVSATTSLIINDTFSNSTPGTTRAIRIENAGTGSWIDFAFSNVLKGSLGVLSNGTMYISAVSDFAFYMGSGLDSLIAQIYGGGLYVNGGGFFSGSVTAGTANTSPASTFTDYGSFGTKIRLITASETLGSTDTEILVDASTAFVCTGTPSTACAGHGSQGACEANNSHNGCSWFAGSSCSAFDNEGGMTTCSGTSGCSVVTSACTGGDQSTCESNDDSYGGTCSWDAGSNTCPSFTNTSTCNANSPCTATVSGDCTTLSDGGGDGTMCATQPECSYDSGSGTCSGSFFTSCDGDNTTPSCNGTYNTGSCTGTYGAACSGTANCSGFVDSGTCSSETGCSGSTGVNVTLPADGTAPFYRTYWIKNVGATGTVSILPNSGQYIEQASTTMNLSKKNASAMFSYYKATADCSLLGSEGACTAQTGCTANYDACSWNGSTCDGPGSCSGQGDQASCEAFTVYASCSGTYVVSKNWYIMSSHLVPN